MKKGDSNIWGYTEYEELQHNRIQGRVVVIVFYHGEAAVVKVKHCSIPFGFQFLVTAKY